VPGKNPGTSTIIVSGSTGQTTLKEGKDYLIGSDSRAYYINANTNKTTATTPKINATTQGKATNTVNSDSNNTSYTILFNRAEYDQRWDTLSNGYQQTSFLGKPVVVLKGAALSIEMRYNFGKASYQAAVHETGLADYKTAGVAFDTTVGYVAGCYVGYAGEKVVKGIGQSIKGAGKVVDDLPSGWTKTTNNGFTHVKDANGNIRVRIDPPDAKTPYPHKHLYDEAGNSLDINGNIVSPKSPDAHIPLK